MYLQCWISWCHMKLLPSRHVLCTPYNHAPCHFMQSHICKVHCTLSVTLSFSCQCIVLCLSLCLFPVSALYSVCHFVFFLSVHCTLSVTLSFSCQRIVLCLSLCLFPVSALYSVCHFVFFLSAGLDLSYYVGEEFNHVVVIHLSVICHFFFMSFVKPDNRQEVGVGVGGGRQRGNKAMFSYPLLVTVFVATCFQAAKSIPKLF